MPAEWRVKAPLRPSSSENLYLEPADLFRIGHRFDSRDPAGFGWIATFSKPRFRASIKVRKFGSKP